MKSALSDFILGKKGIYGILHIIILLMSLFLVISISIDTFKGIPFYTQSSYMKIQLWICIWFLYHHKEGVEGLNPGGGHFPPQDDAVGLLGGEKRERGACLLVGRPEENDEEGDAAQNALMNIVTIMLATGTGLTMKAESFLNYQTILIICLGLVAFAAGTFAGVIFGKIMCVLDGGKTNPLIGSAGVSAVPMAARVSQVVGQKANPSNFLLMHAMGPNVAGVIGTAVAAGAMLAMIGAAK